MVYHIVTCSDTLESLSAYYRIPFCMIIRANMGSGGELLRPGRKIRIPLPSFCTQVERAGTLEGEEDLFSLKKYVLEKGDTLYSLAQKFSTTMAHILGHNNACRPEEFYPGREIRIPCLKEGFLVYTVRAKDTWDMLALRFGMGKEELRRYNQTAGDIYPGMQVIIKSGKT